METVNSYETRHAKWEFSPSVSSALFFFSHSLLFICSSLCFLLSHCLTAASLLSVSASHFSVIEVNRSQPAEEEGSAAAGSSLSPSAEEREQMHSDTPYRWREETQQTIKNGCVFVRVCVFGGGDTHWENVCWCVRSMAFVVSRIRWLSETYLISLLLAGHWGS